MAKTLLRLPKQTNALKTILSAERCDNRMVLPIILDSRFDSYQANSNEPWISWRKNEIVSTS